MARSRPRLEKVTEEMKAWSAMLAGEVAGWPGVNSRPMFGLTALYRNDVIFAVLPKTRGMESGNSLAFRIPETSPRIGVSKRPKCRRRGGSFLRWDRMRT
jgi:hypothetical protein